MNGWLFDALDNIRLIGLQGQWYARAVASLRYLLKINGVEGIKDRHFDLPKCPFGQVFHE
jgi:hypothetical protein